MTADVVVVEQLLAQKRTGAGVADVDLDEAVRRLAERDLTVTQIAAYFSVNRKRVRASLERLQRRAEKRARSAAALAR